jgi:hypothetical protein
VAGDLIQVVGDIADEGDQGRELVSDTFWNELAVIQIGECGFVEEGCGCPAYLNGVLPEDAVFGHLERAVDPFDVAAVLGPHVATTAMLGFFFLRDGFVR